MKDYSSVIVGEEERSYQGEEKSVHRLHPNMEEKLSPVAFV
jgi:hypothetical protein